MVEYLTSTQNVAGSNPVCRTNFKFMGDYCSEFFKNRKTRNIMRNNLDVIVFRLEVSSYWNPEAKIVGYVFSKCEANEWRKSNGLKWVTTSDGPDFYFRPTSLLEFKQTVF